MLKKKFCLLDSQQLSLADIALMLASLTQYVLVLASSNFSINENNMFSALSDDRGYLSLLSFFLHHIKTIMGRVSVLIHINVPAIREREKRG